MCLTPFLKGAGNMEKNQVAWIGAGVMGSHQAAHLAQKGYEVSVYTHKKETLDTLEREYDIHPCGSIKEAVRNADYIFVMVGYPSDVEEVFLCKGGIFECAKEGALAIDMTTSLPTLAEHLYEEGKKRGIRVMDAPVSGGDKGAKNATLSIMVGGEEKDFEEALPLLQCMGRNCTYMGGAGKGQHTKAANQIAVAGATAAYTEALVYACQAGLDPQKLLAAISSGAAGSWQMDNMAPRALAEDFAPGFFIKHFIKDMKIVEEESEKRGMDLKMLHCVLQMYQTMAEHGLSEEGTQALIRYYNESMGK